MTTMFNFCLHSLIAWVIVPFSDYCIHWLIAFRSLFPLKFQEQEKKRYKAEEARQEQKHFKRVEELRRQAEANLRELEQDQVSAAFLFIPSRAVTFTLILEMRKPIFGSSAEWESEGLDGHWKLQDASPRERQRSGCPKIQE